MLKGKQFIFIVIFSLSVIFIIGIDYKNRLTKNWLESISFTDILIRPGDLSDGFIPGTYSRIEPNPEYDRFVVQVIHEIQTDDHDRAGAVIVVLFVNNRDKASYFSLLSQVESQEGIIPYPIEGVGECDTCFTAFATDYSINLGFTRCHAIGWITLDRHYENNYSFSYLSEHIKQLDQRLQPLVCK